MDSDLSDAELGAMPCAFGTAENMLQRAPASRSGQHVVVTGASGGVGSAAVQLARLRGAEVTAIAAARKAEQVLDLGAARVVDRDATCGVLAEHSVDVVVDNVSGPGSSGCSRCCAAAARTSPPAPSPDPASTFDKRTFYLRDLTMIGCTAWDEPVFPALVVALVERDELRPPVAGTVPAGAHRRRRRRSSSRRGTSAARARAAGRLARRRDPKPRAPRRAGRRLGSCSSRMSRTGARRGVRAASSSIACAALSASSRER